MTQTAPDFARSAAGANAIVAAGGAFWLGMRRNLAGWPVLMGRSLFYIVAITILSALWSKVAGQRLPGTLAAVLPAGGLALYIGVTEWITLSIAAVHLRLEDDIRFGMLEPHLLRPKPYLLQRIAEAMGDSFGRLMGLGATAMAMLILSGDAMPALSTLAFVLVLGLLGTAIGVLLLALTGLVAFWIRRVMPVYLIMQKSIFLLGGLFAPISLYPAWFYHAAAWTPFAANIFYAGNQMLQPSAAAFVEGLILQLFWIAAISLLIALIWRAGLRKVMREGL